MVKAKISVFVSAVFALTGTLFAGYAASISVSSPASAAKSLTPKETILSWNYEDKTADEVLSYYKANTPTEMQFARVLATQGVAEATLQKLVRTKWGHDAETALAHVCLTDTHEDDEAAQVAVNGPHAIIKYDIPNMAPLFMVQNNDGWKIDVSAYMSALGDQLNASMQYCNKSSALYSTFSTAIKAGKYQNERDFETDFKKASDTLDAGQ